MEKLQCLTVCVENVIYMKECMCAGVADYLYLFVFGEYLWKNTTASVPLALEMGRGGWGTEEADGTVYILAP